MSDRQAGTRSPRNVQYLRKSNRGAILRALVELGQSTRVELAEALGLTKMAISTIVSDLLGEGLVEESRSPSEGGAQGIGRKPIALRIPKLRLNAIGVLITRHEIECLAMDITGEIIGQTAACLPEGITNQEFEGLLVAQVKDMLTKYAHLNFVGIGVASLGPLNIFEQVLLYPPNFRGLGGIRIGKLLRREFHMPVYMENDMNAGALAEQFYGQGKNIQNLIYVGFGSGVGAGVIVNGTMLRGGSGFAGELGHVSTDLNGPLCSCGQRGCLEMYTSTGALLVASGTQSMGELRALLGGTRPPRVVRAVEQYLRAISVALITVANLFDPDIIIVSEQHGLLGPEQMRALSRELNQNMFQHGFRTIDIRSSAFGPQNMLIGGATLVFREIFSGKLKPD